MKHRIWHSVCSSDVTEMSKILLFLFLCFSLMSVHAQVLDDDDQLAFIKLFHIDDFNSKDTSSVVNLEVNLGSSCFKQSASISDDFLSGLQYDIKLLFRFSKKPRLFNGAIGVQFTENHFNLLDQYANISNDGISFSSNVYENTSVNRIKMRSINFPIMLYFSNRQIEFFNKFKLGFGVVPGFNFKQGIQKTMYQIDENEYNLKEVSDFDLQLFRGGILFEFFFNNICIYYEHGISGKSGLKNFTTGINKVGVGLIF